MAIMMPTFGVMQQQFRIQRVDYLSPTKGGKVGSVTGGFPLWEGAWSLSAVDSDDSDEWTAFVDSLRGSQRTFVAYDVTRPYPKAHAGGFRRMLTVDGDPFFGDCVSWSQAIDPDTNVAMLTLDGVPSGLCLSRRDYVGFRWGDDRLALVRSTGAAQADEYGSITIPVEPAVPALVPSDAVAYLNQPGCTMRLQTDDVDVDTLDLRHALAGGRFAGIQTLLA